MSELKLRLLSYRPARDNGALLPAGLAVLLLAGAALQLALPQAAAIPPDSTPGRAPDRALPAVRAVATIDLGGRTSPFSPLRVLNVAAGEAGGAVDGGTPPPPRRVGPLGGTYLLGSTQIGAARAVVLREPDGRVLRLRPGAAYRGWRLVTIGPDAALFRKRGKPVRIGYGTTVLVQQAAGAPAASDDESESEE